MAILWLAFELPLAVRAGRVLAPDPDMTVELVTVEMPAEVSATRTAAAAHAIDCAAFAIPEDVIAASVEAAEPLITVDW